MALMYCKKCGRLIQGHYDDDDRTPCYCDCCNSVTYKVPIEFLISESVPIINSDSEQQFIEKYIISSSEFDQYLFDHREEILARQSAEFNAKMEQGKAILEKQSRLPECPTCHSKNVQSISGIERGASIIGLGIFSKKINKSYKCKHCGYTW